MRLARITGTLEPGGAQLSMLPIPPEEGIRLDYEMAMGVRQGEKDWLHQVDGWIGAHRQEISQILDSFHVPQLPLTAPRS